MHSYICKGDYENINGHFKWPVCKGCAYPDEDGTYGDHCANCERFSDESYPTQYVCANKEAIKKITRDLNKKLAGNDHAYGSIDDWIDEVHKAIGYKPDDNYDRVPYEDVEKNIEKEAGFDAVSHPSHYTEGRQYEPRKVIHDWGLNFNLGNAVKYISRAGRKGDALEDLKKARQYLDFEIEEMEKEDK